MRLGQILRISVICLAGLFLLFFLFGGYEVCWFFSKHHKFLADARRLALGIDPVIEPKAAELISKEIARWRNPKAVKADYHREQMSVAINLVEDSSVNLPSRLCMTFWYRSYALRFLMPEEERQALIIGLCEKALADDSLDGRWLLVAADLSWLEARGLELGLIMDSSVKKERLKKKRRELRKLGLLTMDLLRKASVRDLAEGWYPLQELGVACQGTYTNGHESLLDVAEEDEIAARIDDAMRRLLASTQFTAFLPPPFISLDGYGEVRTDGNINFYGSGALDLWCVPRSNLSAVGRYANRKAKKPPDDVLPSLNMGAQLIRYAMESDGAIRPSPMQIYSSLARTGKGIIHHQVRYMSHAWPESVLEQEVTITIPEIASSVYYADLWGKQVTERLADLLSRMRRIQQPKALLEFTEQLTGIIEK